MVVVVISGARGSTNQVIIPSVLNIVNSRGRNIHRIPNQRAERLCLLQNAFNQTSKTVEMTRALLILRLRGFVVGGLKRERGHGSSWCALSLCKIFKAI